MPGTMVPVDERLPQVLPTERLGATGKARAARCAPSCAASTTCATSAASLLCWAQPVGRRRPRRVARPTRSATSLAFVLMGAGFARFAILGHEAAHRLLFTDKRANDWVGRWLVAYPAFVPFEAYRRSHFAHHKEEFGPNEPDIPLYARLPDHPGQSWRRKLWRDAVGIIGLEEPQAAASAPCAPRAAGRSRCASSAAQAVLLALATGGRATGAVPRCSGCCRG